MGAKFKLSSNTISSNPWLAVSSSRSRPSSPVAAPVAVARPPSPSAYDLPPRPGRYTTDRAGVLGAARERALDEKLAAFERATSNQVVVYVDKKLPESAVLEEVANRAF